MADVVVVATILAFFGATALLGLAVRRATEDWQYQLRVVRVLSLIGSYDTSASFDLWEVELVGATPTAGSLTVAFSPVDRPQEVSFLLLETPLGEMAERCASWRNASTPMLLSADARGAVLHGPDGYLLGRVAARRDLEPFDVSLS